jgi:MFS family permease
VNALDHPTRRPLFRQRNFMLLWSGQLVSWIGTEVTGITLPLVVLALTGSPARAGAIAAVRGVIYVLLAIPAGALVDRWDRRRVMVLANIGSGLAMGSIPLAIVLGHLTLAHLYIAGAAEGACFVFANLARFAALARVVTPEEYPAARAQTSLASNVALLLGPPLGGTLYQLAGAGLALLLDACSYLVNAVSIFFITVPLQDTSTRESTSLATEIRSAMAWLWQQRILRHLNVLMAGRTAIASGLYLLIVVMAKQEGAPSAVIGLIFAAGALGGLAGAVTAGRFHRRYRTRAVLVATTAVTWLLVSGYLGAHQVVILAALTAAIYAVDPLFEVTVASYTAARVPDAMRGRVTSLTRLVELGSYALGLAVTGTLLESVGTMWTVGVFSVISLLLSLFAALNPLFRKLP